MPSTMPVDPTWLRPITLPRQILPSFHRYEGPAGEAAGPERSQNQAPLPVGKTVQPPVFYRHCHRSARTRRARSLKADQLSKPASLAQHPPQADLRKTGGRTRHTSHATGCSWDSAQWREETPVRLSRGPMRTSERPLPEHYALPRETDLARPPGGRLPRLLACSLQDERSHNNRAPSGNLRVQPKPMRNRGRVQPLSRSTLRHVR